MFEIVVVNKPSVFKPLSSTVVVTDWLMPTKL